jgi:hypothetical protein
MRNLLHRHSEESHRESSAPELLPAASLIASLGPKGLGLAVVQTSGSRNVIHLDTQLATHVFMHLDSGVDHIVALGEFGEGGVEEGDRPGQAHALVGVIVFFLQIDTLSPKNSKHNKHLQDRLLQAPCAFGAD